MKNFKDLGISKPSINSMVGEKIKVDRILNKEIEVLKFSISESKYNGSLLTMQIKTNNESRIVFTGSIGLIDQIKQVNKDDFPFKTMIVKENEFYEFN